MAFSFPPHSPTNAASETNGRRRFEKPLQEYQDTGSFGVGKRKSVDLTADGNNRDGRNPAAMIRYGAKTRRAPQPPPRALRGAGVNELSVVAAFDEFARNAAVLYEGAAEEAFAKATRRTAAWAKRWRESDAARREALDLAREKDRQLLAKDYQIKQAQRLVVDERRGRLQAEAERDTFAQQLEMLKNILLSDGRRGVDDETLERVRVIDTTTRRTSPHKGAQEHHRLPAVEESAESILDVSDLSFDETRDESRHVLGLNRSKRASVGGPAAAAKKRRSLSAATGDKVLATTTKVTLDREGNAHAESIIEAVPVADLKRKARKSRESRGERRVTYNERNLRQEYSPSAPPYADVIREMEVRQGLASRGGAAAPATPSPSSSPLVKRNFSNAGSIRHRPHNWQKMSSVRTDRCGPCGKRIGFNKSRFACKECHAVCHIDCRENVPVPCVAASNRTPSNKSQGSYLADFTPLESPMVPALLIHCFREVEARGLDEVGIYRIPGNEADTNEVVQKFLRGKGTPSLDRYEVHVVASAVKKFLRSLKEPVIPSSLWRTFVDAANNPDATDGEAALYQAVSELPKPNRETLAFMALHLQKVSESPETKMSIDNLGRVWGPTIVGHSSPDPEAMMSELPLQVVVVKALLSLPSDYWGNFLQFDDRSLGGGSPRFPPVHTPEHSGTPFFMPSALKTGGMVARRTRSKIMARQKYFESPMLF